MAQRMELTKPWKYKPNTVALRSPSAYSTLEKHKKERVTIFDIVVLSNVSDARPGIKCE